MSAQPQFKVVKVLNFGTDHPVVARLWLQLATILDSGFIDLPKETIDRIQTLLFDNMNDVLHIEETSWEYLCLEEENIVAIMAQAHKGLGTTSISFTDPTLRLSKMFEDCVMRSIIVIRRIRRIASLILGVDCNKGNFLINRLLPLLEPTDQNRTWIERNNDWIKELYDLRGLIEHEQLSVQPFDVRVTEGGQIAVAPPSLMQEQVLLRDYIQQTLRKLFMYCEGIVIMMLNMKVIPPVGITKVSEQEVKDHNGSKYIIGLNSVSSAQTPKKSSA